MREHLVTIRVVRRSEGINLADDPAKWGKKITDGYPPSLLDVRGGHHGECQ